MFIAFHLVNVVRKGVGVGANISIDKASNVFNWIQIRYTLFQILKLLKL
jgi:hypothetical protein